MLEEIRKQIAPLTGTTRMYKLLHLGEEFIRKDEQAYVASLPALPEQELGLEHLDLLVLHMIHQFHNDNDDMVERHISEATAILLAHSRPKEVAPIYSHIGVQYSNVQEYRLAARWLEALIALVEQHELHVRIEPILNNLGLAYMYLYRLSDSLPILKRGLALNLSRNDPDIINSYNNIGSCYYRLGLHVDALENYRMALDACQRHGNRKMPPIILNNIANIKKDNGETEEALEFYSRALEEFGTDQRAVAVTLNNIGTLHSERGEHTQALENFARSIALCQSHHFPYTYAKNLMETGITYMHMKRYDLAWNSLQQARDEAESIGDSYLQNSIRLAQGRVQLLRGNLQDAEQLLLEAERRKSDHDGYALELLQAIVDLYTELGDIHEVNKRQKQLLASLEIQLDESYLKKVAAMQAALDFDLKEQEVKLQQQKALALAKKNREISLQKEKLERTLAELQRSEISCEFLHNEVKDTLGSAIIGDSEQVSNILSIIRQVAATPATSVLITGETGVGKELVARAIHDLSDRSKRNFCAVNVSSIPATLFESEFFGYRKNAFTGADRDKTGWFRIADGGTLFLDEVGTWQYEMQAKFLRVLESRKIIPVGSQREIPVNFRLISATNDDLHAKIDANQFRADLYYRLASFVIHIPPLRERIDDIEPLLDYFIRQFNTRLKKNVTRVERQVLSALKSYEFPGNVRELRNMVEHAMIITKTSTLRLASFSIPQQARPQATIAPLHTIEKDMIVRALRQTRFHQANAAKLLGISAKALERRMKKHNIMP